MEMFYKQPSPATADWTWQPPRIWSWATSTIPRYSNASLAYTRKLNSIFTTWGYYRWTKLPSGISSASKERQSRIHLVLAAAPMTWKPESTTLVTFNKMKFLVHKATCISQVTTTDGLQPNPVTVRAIITMPTPTDKQAVRRFQGALNYLARFCPQLTSSVTQPLCNLTKEDMLFLFSIRH